jgi:class 3 adenylate cyclase
MADAPEPQPQSPPAQGGDLAQRVADADRDRTVMLLREHVVEGRLTLDEFSERVGLALQATTRGDLDAVMADLPVAQARVPEQSQGVRKGRRWHIAVMSGHSTKGRWRIGEKTTAVAVMGGCDMDLRRAEIEGPEVEITAVAFWGGVEVTVPEGFDVELRGFSFMGGRSLRLRDVPIIPGSPRIVIRGFAVMGGIEVRSRSSQSGRQAARAVSEHVLGVVDAISSRSGPGPGPIDLAALKREIRREMHDQRRGTRRDGRDAPGPTFQPGPTFRPGPAAPPGPSEAPEASEPAMSPAAPLPAATEPFAPDGTVTIVFCDMVDYAGMTERLGDQGSRQLLQDHHRLVREAVARHGGREINVQGDGFMLAFGGAARALRCAIDIQRAVQAYTPSPGGEPIAVHIGIHTGDAVTEADDFLGLTVIVASRLADSAGPGEILVSSLSEQLVQGSGEFTFSGHRETALKGMTRAQLSATLAWAE